MLKKRYRALKSHEVADLFDGTSYTVSNPYFRILWKQYSQSYPQFVVITPLSLTKSAPLRNRLRRMIYGDISLYFSQWTIGMRVAILIKTPALALSRSQYYQRFRSLMQSAKFFSFFA